MTDSLYDVLIIGAGPAGCACALALKDAGLKVALLDKASFPRDKVCGDAINGMAIKILKSLSPEFEKAFKQVPKKSETKRTTLYYRNKTITFNWEQEAYTCARMEFDNFLYSLVKGHTNTDIFTNTLPGSFIKNDDGYTITINNSTTVFHTKILIGADGAHSAVAKQLANYKLDRSHHVGSVRAYFSNIAGVDSNTAEIYFDKRFLPSYLWVFPLPGNTANVGFGMLSDEIARRKISIKKAFYEFIDNVPELKLKFKDATQQGTLEGFGLPLGSNIGTISGTHFMLTGDAASLIDPISGDGICNAILSGKLAAAQAVKCAQQHNYTDTFMKQYDRSLMNYLGKELKTHYKAQRLLSKTPSLLDLVFFACRSPMLKKMIGNRL